MLREALTYPLRADEETLVVGTGLAVAAGLLARLGLFGVLAVAPTILLAGYATAVLRESAAPAGGSSADEPPASSTSAGGASAAADAPPANEDAPPAFADARTLAADGARALAVTVGYLAAPAVALAVTLGGSAPAESPTVGVSLLVLGAGTVVLFAALSFAYLLPAALVAVARTRTLRAGVAPGRLRRHATDARYFVGWVAAVTVVGVTVLLVDALGALGRPGEVVGLAAGFYATVVAARLSGRSVAG